MLEQFVADDPSDPFNHYALALELTKSDKNRAKQIFNQLLNDHPGYVPVYYQLALLNFELGSTDEAFSVIRKGIIEAKKQSDLKAGSELQSLLDETEL